MTKRFVKNSIYAISMLLIAIYRIVVSKGLFSGLNPLQSDTAWSVVVQCGLMGVVPFLLYFFYLKINKDKHALKTISKEFRYDSLPDKKSWVLIFFISIFSTFLVTCISNVWYNLIVAMGYTPAISSQLQYDGVGVLFADIALTAMLPAIFEEFTNRGLFYSANDNARFPTFAIFSSALMFALMHTNVTQVFYTFVFGLITGALVYTTKSIYPAMFCHFVNNFIAVMKSYERQSGRGLVFLNKVYDYLLGTTAGGIISIIMFIIVAYIVFILFLKTSVIESEKRIRKGTEVLFVKEDYGRFDKAPVYLAITMNLLITIFTFVWGVMR